MVMDAHDISAPPWGRKVLISSLPVSGGHAIAGSSDAAGSIDIKGLSTTLSSATD